MIIVHRTTVEGDGDNLSLGDFREVLTNQDIPDDASVTPILRERGSQRDPITVLVGVTFTWRTTS